MWRYNRSIYRGLRRQAREIMHREGLTHIVVDEGEFTPPGLQFDRDGSCRIRWEEPWAVPFFQNWHYAQQCRRDGCIGEARRMLWGCRQIRLRDWLAPQLCLLP